MTSPPTLDNPAANRIAIAELGAIAGYAANHTPDETIARLRARVRQLLATNRRIGGWL